MDSWYSMKADTPITWEAKARKGQTLETRSDMAGSSQNETPEPEKRNPLQIPGTEPETEAEIYV